MGALLQNRYRLDSELGRGGMGVVYLAHDTLLDRPVAVKLLSRPGLGTEGRARLLNEARAAARLDHPNIVAVFDAGEARESDGTPFIVMQLVEGRSLHDRPPASLDETLAIAVQVCAALDHAHEHGIVHRDLKPENILITSSGAAKLMDFGLARSAATRLTSEGALVGTVFYLAPEQALGREIDGRADLYALGVMLYELVTGRLPFMADDPLAVISQHLYAPVVPPRTLRADLPPPLEAVILKLLAKDPAERYATAGAVAGALELAGQQAAAEETATGAVGLLQGLARGRLVGRRAEVSQLRELWARAQEGQGHLALISGEPGIGKTRLTNEIQVVAQLNGAAVLRGGCYEYEAATPYLPFAEALRDWVRLQKTETLGRLLGPAAPELAKLAPEIESRLGPLEPNPPLPPAEERLRLFDHAARFFRALAGDRGLLLIIDDLHWADQGTLALLHYLLRHLRQDRLLALGAYREVELDRTHPLAAALVEWNRERLATRLALGRLSLEDTGAQLATLFGQTEVSQDFATVIHRETEGNPFFVEEVVKSLIEQGQIYRENGGWGRKEIAELAIPQSIKEAVGRRLNRLSGECVEALHTAAALGKIFAFRELAAASTQSEDQLLNALDEAAAAQLILPGSGESFAFTHDKIREVLYEELNPIRRRRLHQRLGEALARLYAADLSDHVEDLAYHFAEAGDLSQSFSYSLQAAQKAARFFSLDEALSYYEQAREAAEALNLTDQLVAVYEGQGDIHAWRGKLNEAVEALKRALALSVTPQTAAVLKSKIGSVYVWAGADEGLEYLQAALSELDPHTQPEAMALATATVGRYYHLHGQHRRAVETFEQALALAEPLDNPYTLTNIYGYLAGAYQHLAQYDQSIEWARRSIAYGEGRNYPLAIAIGHEFLAEDMQILGRWREALEHAEQDRVIGERFGALDRVAWADFCTSFARLGQGELALGAEAARASLQRADTIGDRRLAVVAGAGLAHCLADMGDLEAAQAAATTAHAAKEASGQFYLFGESGLALARVHGHLGQWERAAALLDERMAAVAPTDNRLMRFRLGAYHAETYCALGRFADAARLAAEAGALARAAESTHFEALARRVEAQALAGLERWAEALTAFDEAVATFDELESRLDLARALHYRGLLHQSQGRASEARADWSRALALYTACGARPEAEKIARTLQTK